MGTGAKQIKNEDQKKVARIIRKDMCKRSPCSSAAAGGQQKRGCRCVGWAIAKFTMLCTWDFAQTGEGF